jgi:hypothetical protein
MTKRVSIDIGIPMGREFMFFKTAESLFNLDRRGLKFNLIVGMDAELAEKRNQIVRKFLEGKSEFLLFVDDDMVLPADLARKLAAYNVPVIAPLATMRMPPFPPVIYERGVMGITNKWVYPQDKPFTVDVVGTGVLMIRRDVLEQMEEPWFAWGDYQIKGNRMGEDIYFSDKVRFELGLPIWIDPSLKVGHIGFKVATADDWQWHWQNRELFPQWFGNPKKGRRKKSG